MKFKVKPEKSNFIFMSSIIILCFISCLMWLSLRLYFYSLVYLSLTLIIAHIYYFTFYILEKNFLVIKLGFLKIKIHYQNLESATLKKKSVILKWHKISFKIYPEHNDVFMAKLGENLTNKNS